MLANGLVKQARISQRHGNVARKLLLILSKVFLVTWLEPIRVFKIGAVVLVAVFKRLGIKALLA